MSQQGPGGYGNPPGGGGPGGGYPAGWWLSPGWRLPPGGGYPRWWCSPSRWLSPGRRTSGWSRFPARCWPSARWSGWPAWTASVRLRCAWCARRTAAAKAKGTNPGGVHRPRLRAAFAARWCRGRLVLLHGNQVVPAGARLGVSSRAARRTVEAPCRSPSPVPMAAQRSPSDRRLATGASVCDGGRVLQDRITAKAGQVATARPRAMPCDHAAGTLAQALEGYRRAPALGAVIFRRKKNSRSAGRSLRIGVGSTMPTRLPARPRRLLARRMGRRGSLHQSEEASAGRGPAPLHGSFPYQYRRCLNAAAPKGANTRTSAKGAGKRPASTNKPKLSIKEKQAKKKEKAAKK